MSAALVRVPSVGWWDDAERHETERFWMAHPAVRARINRRVSGDPGVWPTTWLACWSS